MVQFSTMTGSHETIFGLLIGCADGRTHPALETYASSMYGITALDKLTRPGYVGRIAQEQ